MRADNYVQAFFDLVRAGLWNKEARIAQHVAIDFETVLNLAREQSMVGYVTAGLEHVSDMKVSQPVALKFAGQTLQIEQRNQAMNAFVAELIEKLRKAGINAVLVKGQGIAQCYDRPLWRSPGDVDLLLNEDDYEKAKLLLVPMANHVESEFTHLKHIGFSLDGWMVELHGTLRSRLSKHVDNEVDAVQKEVLFRGKIRSWMNGTVQVLLPAPDEDVFFVFTHILHHFFLEGIGLKQICDWCRLLYTYRETVDSELLEKRLRKAGLMSEWKAFAAFAVEYLGMPVEAMPLFNEDDNHNDNLKKKAERICRFVMEVGNFGHNQRRDFSGMSYMRRKFVSFWGRLSDMLRHFRIFPLDSIRFFGGVLRSGLHAAVRGE